MYLYLTECFSYSALPGDEQAELEPDDSDVELESDDDEEEGAVGDESSSKVRFVLYHINNKLHISKLNHNINNKLHKYIKS